MTGFAWRCDDRSAPWVVGNWKMNGDEATFREIDTVAQTAGRSRGVRIALAVPHTMIASTAREAGGLVIGAQDVHQASEGAFTGSVSARMVRDAGASFTILGHSERRAACGEDSAMLRAKVDRAFEAGLGILLCCGETAAIRAAGGTADFVLRQLTEALSGCFDVQSIAVAYEPCWAIGAADAPSIDDIVPTLYAIRQWLNFTFENAGQKMPILYGGAVDAPFTSTLRHSTVSDGVLIGRASLSGPAVISIVNQI